MTTGGKAQGVYVVTDAQLESNGGTFRVFPGPAVRVSAIDAAVRGVTGSLCMPVYVVDAAYVAAHGAVGGKPLAVADLTSVARSVEHPLIATPVYVMEGTLGAEEEPAPPSWSPLDLASLVAWWDFSDAGTLFTDAGTTPVSGDADLIYQVNDKSTAGENAVQTTEANRPEYKVNIQNGQSAALFTAADPNTFVVSLAQMAASTIVIAQQTTGDIGLLGSTEPAPQVRIGSSGANKISGYDNANNPLSEEFATARTSWTIPVWRHSASTVQFYESGTARGTGTLTTTQAITRIGTIADILPVSGYIGEIVVCNAALSDPDLNLLGAYLDDKWNITWTPVT